MPKIKEGIKAPDFSLKDKDGTIHKLKEIDSDFTVIFFYPKDNTPGCTIESKGFNKKLTALKKLGAEVIGISGGDEKSKAAFCKKHGLKITLLSDTDFKVSRKYAAFGEKTFMGRKFDGIYRKTFILDKKKKVIRIFDKVTPDTHPEEVAKFIKSL